MDLMKCDEATCNGHLAKFSSCLAEVLWCASLDGAGDSVGDCDFRGYHTLIEVTAADAGRWTYDDVSADVPAGWYIVTTVSSGAVYLSRYGDDGETARSDFDHEARLYDDWSGEEID